MKSRLLLIAFVVFCAVSASAQKDRNYIFLFDCTKSMQGYGDAPDIWTPTVNFLEKTINDLPPSSRVTIIPFQGSVADKVYSITREEMDNRKWKSINEDLNSLVGGKPTNTNICSAWRMSDKSILKDYDNYIILLTDGIDNVNGIPAVTRMLREWCGKHESTNGFYVTLTDNAFTSSDPTRRKELEELKKAIDECGNLSTVDVTGGPIRPFGRFLKNTLTVNTLELPKTFRVPFSTFGEYPVNVKTSGNLEVSIDDGKIDKGYADITLRSKYATVQELNDAIGEEMAVQTFKVEPLDKSNLLLMDPEMEIMIINKPERVLSIGEDYMGQANLKDSHYYPSFLFAKESDLDTVYCDLHTVFNQPAREAGAKLFLKLKDTKGYGDDFALLLNGRILNSEEKIEITSGENTVLGIVFNPDAREGKRIIQLSYAGSQSLDRVNSDYPDEFNLILKTNRKVGWNPLATVLFWLSIVLLAALIIWFAGIRPIRYPKLRIGSLTLDGPDTFYGTVKLRGSIRAVISSGNNYNQGFISRIFKGKETVYNRFPDASSPIIITPSKKRARIKGNYEDWAIDVSSFRQGDTFTIRNLKTGGKTKVMVN